MFRARPALAATVALLAASACQQTGETMRLAEAAPAPAASPETQVLPQYALHYLDMGESLRLAYGVADSDAVRLMMDCERGSGRIALSDNATSGETLALASGGVASELSGVVAPGVTAPIVMVEAPAGQPALAAFRRSGRIEVGEGAGRYAIQAARFERYQVEQFFAGCEQA